MRVLAVAAWLACVACVICFQAAASVNPSPEGRQSMNGLRSPPRKRKYYTPLGWRYRKIAFVFEALGIIGGFGMLWLIRH